MGAYDDMTDQDLMNLANKTMGAAVDEPIGSIERAMKWAAFESVMGELKRRMARHLEKQLGLPDSGI
jgi:hypothetical protein